MTCSTNLFSVFPQSLYVSDSNLDDSNRMQVTCGWRDFLMVRSHTVMNQMLNVIRNMDLTL